MANAEVQALVKEIRRNGFTVEIGDGGIGKVLWKGEQVYKHEQDGGTPVTIHQTPSDHRWRKNLIPVLIRAKVLESDPLTSSPRKITVTPETSQAFQERQLKPWIERRLTEGFTVSVLSNAIVTRWPRAFKSEGAVKQQIGNIRAGKQKSLRTQSFEAWKEVVEGWSKNPALPPKPPEPKADTNGHTGNGKLLELPKEKLPERPSIPLSARCLAMMMDSYPDRDEALLLHLELVELEERVYA